MYGHTRARTRARVLTDTRKRRRGREAPIVRATTVLHASCANYVNMNFDRPMKAAERAGDGE